MNNKSKIALSLFLSSSLLFSSVYAEDLGKLKEQKEEVNGKKEELEGQLHKVEGEISSVKKKLGEISNEIAKTDAKINETQILIDKKTEEINKTIDEIKATEIKLEEKKAALAKNLRKLHMKGEVTMMEYLFRSEDVSEFFDRFNLIKRVAKANRLLYEEVRETKRMLEEQKTHLEKEKKLQEEAKAELVSLKKSQEEKKAQEMTLLHELVEKERLVEHEIDQQEAAMAELNAMISAEIKRREEERKRREEEARKKREAGQEPPAYDEPVGSGQFMIPIPAGRYVISSPFGWRTHPITGAKTLHNGVDFAAPYNTPILAVDSGTVVYAGPARGYGNWIVIDHNNGYYSIYGHMFSDQLYVYPGQHVSRGQHIAGVGTAGSSTGNHLHLAISKNGINVNFVDPMSLF